MLRINLDVIMNPDEERLNREKHREVLLKIERIMHLLTEVREDTMDIYEGLPEDKEHAEHRKAIFEAVDYLISAYDEADDAFDAIYQITKKYLIMVDKVRTDVLK